MRLPLLAALGSLCAGCAGIESVVSEYGMRTKSATFETVIVDNLNDGTFTLGDEAIFGAEHCLFETDVSAAVPPAGHHIDLDLNGRVGTAGSNAHLYAFNGTDEPCLPQGSPVAVVDIDLSTGQPLALNQPVAIVASTITLADGSVFSADGLYGRLTIVEVEETGDPANPGDDQVTGTFELVAANQNDPNDSRYLFLRGGIFSTTP